MTEPPITEPEATAPAIPVSTKPVSRRRSLRKAAQLPTVQLARLTSISGIIFAALFVVAIILVHTTPTLSASDAEITAYYASNSTLLVTVGLYLVPFAGIAFLWHAHCTRLLIEARTPPPSPIPYGLQLVSGVLFVVLLFAGTASAGAVALLKDLTNAPLPSADFVRGMLAVGYGMVFVYALRGAGMYALTTTTLLRNAMIMPKWLAVVSYLLALFLLLITTLHPAAVLVFPTWVVIVSVVIFIRAGRASEPALPERQSA